MSGLLYSSPEQKTSAYGTSKADDGDGSGHTTLLGYWTSMYPNMMLCQSLPRIYGAVVCCKLLVVGRRRLDRLVVSREFVADET
jgi:hypothetical protein